MRCIYPKKIVAVILLIMVNHPLENQGMIIDTLDR